MPTPDRPDPDDIIASTWGQWVHDDNLRLRIFGFAREDITIDAAGNGRFYASSLGLSTADMIMATCLNSGCYVTNYVDEGGVSWVVTIVDTNGAPRPAGAYTLAVVGWGTRP